MRVTNKNWLLGDPGRSTRRARARRVFDGPGPLRAAFGLLSLALAVVCHARQPCLPDIDGDRQPIFTTPTWVTAPCVDPDGWDCAQAASTAIADLNGDGHPDIAVAHTNESTPLGGYTILLNRGDAIFDPGTYQIVKGGRFADVAAFDVDRDGDNDLAFVEFDNAGVWIYLNDGSAKFTPAYFAAVGADPLSLVTGDFNEDGSIDLLVLNGYSNDLSLLLNAGAPGGPPVFLPELRVRADPDGVRMDTADFNDDGHLDVAIPGFHHVDILFGDGNGAFAPGPILPHPNSKDQGRQIIARDLNSDGHPDIASSFAQSPTIAVWLSDGAGAFSVPVVYDVSTKVALPTTQTVFSLSLAAGDFDGDGDIDLATNFFWASWQVVGLLNKGNGTFGDKFIRSGVHGIHPFGWFIKAADLNHDQLDDVLTLAETLGQGSVWSLLSLPGEPLASPAPNEEIGDTYWPTMNYYPANAAFADLDGKPPLDMVGVTAGSQATSGGLVTHLGGTGSGPGTPYVPDPSDRWAFWHALAVDLDGDRLDEVVASDWITLSTLSPNGRLIVFANVAGQFGVRQKIETTDFTPYDATAADIDKDGDLDVFVACHESFKPGAVPFARVIADLRNDGAGTLVPSKYWPIDDTLPFGVFGGVTAADFDGDGWTDLAGGASSLFYKAPSYVRTLWNDGKGGFIAGDRATLPGKLTALTSHDFNLDGLREIVAVHSGFGSPLNEALLTGLRHTSPRVFEPAIISNDPEQKGDRFIRILPGAPPGLTWVAIMEDRERIGVYTVKSDMTLESSHHYSAGNNVYGLSLANLDGVPTLAFSEYGYSVVSALRSRSCPNPPGGCPPDCDFSGALDIDDFICFQTKYAVGAMGTGGADCDGDGALSIDDFLCFQAAYALGC